MLRTIKWLFILGILGAAGWFGWRWYQAQAFREDALALIPADAIYAIVTNDPIKSWKDIAGTRTWGHLQKNTYIASLTASANALDSLIRENDFLFNMIGSRALVASAHMTGEKEYDFLFLVDLKEVAGIKFLNDYVSTFSAEGYSFKKEKYDDQDLVILHNPAKNSHIYMSIPGSNLIISFTKKLITASLDTRKSGKSPAKETFEKAGDDLESGGIARIFLNYAMLPALMGCYSGPNEYVNHLSRELKTTSLTLSIDEDLISAKGHTYVADSVESYLKTLSISGKGSTEIAEIAPQRTSFYLGFGFSSFAEFFRNFEKNLQKDVAEYKKYRANLSQVEEYLSISLQSEFIDWIGDEVAMFELQSSGKGLDNEVALVFKAYDIEKARRDLEHIEKMVRRKTPVKFKAVDHRGYKINYLSMKGMFKVLLGKFFARYDKPYYTVINNFVIFSNHPQTLESIVDDYLDKKTLARSQEFRDFRKEFDDESSVFVYVNTPVFFNTMKSLADNKTRLSMETNKKFITCFRHIGFQLTPETGRFRTMFAEQFVAPEEANAPLIVKKKPEPFDQVKSEGDTVAEEKTPVIIAETKDADQMALPYIYAKDLNATTFTFYFPDSTVNFKVGLKNGFKDGLFTEFYQNGETKMKGHFKKDKRDGVWRLWDESGKLILKRTYNEDLVTKESK
jgi:hypothetical protein